MKKTKLGSLDARITGGTDGDGGGEGPVVVLLHGFGAPGDDLVALWRVLAAPRGTRYVFPEAPVALGPEYGGGRAWWWIDLEARMRRERAGSARDVAEVPEGLDLARPQVDGLLDEVVEVLRPPPGKLVLGGFSQGAMVSADVALRSTRALAGLVLMSGTHIAANEWASRLEARRSLPVFMSHGREDPILPFAVSEGLRDTFVAAGLAVDWVAFRGGHAIPPSVVSGVGAFLGRVLGEGPTG
jgi:phospholipase/carboxylesterase